MARRFGHYLWVVGVLTLVLGGFCSAQDQTAPDAAAKPEKVDARLDQKVTYKASAEPIRQVLEELSAKTGVKMDCGANLKDWQVRDRKVSIFAKDMPLKELQAAIADVLRFSWIRDTTDDSFNYRLIQDIRARQKEEALRQIEKEGLTKLRQKAIGDIDGIEAMSGAQMTRMKSDSPFLYGIAREPLGKALSDFLHTVPYVEGAVDNGTEVTVDASKLSKTASDATKTLAIALDTFYRRLNNAQWTPLSEMADQLGSVRITINPLTQQSQQDAEERARNVVGSFEISLASVYAAGSDAPGDSMVSVDLYNPKSDQAKAIGKALIRAQETGSAVEPEYSASDAATDVSEASTNEDTTDTQSDTDPASKQIKLTIMHPATVDTILEELADKAGLQIISDCFYRDNLSVSSSYIGDLSTFLRQLDMSAKVHATLTGKTLTVVDNKWYMKRAWAVPDEWLSHWKEQIRKGTFGLAQLAEIASLTDDQIANTIFRESDIGSRVRGPLKEREVLQFYNALASGEKKRLSSQAGLDPASLGQHQQPYFERIYSRLLPGRMLTSIQPKDVKMMTMRLVGDANSGNYTFHLMDRTPNPLTGNQEVELASWTVLMGSQPVMR